MLKLIYSDSHPEVVRSAEGCMSQLISYGAKTGIKSASAGFMRGILEELKPDRNHFAIHLIAVGDGEQYGPNRNGDYFPKKANQEYHPCFVKFGHFFRHHQNKDPQQAIGIVKASTHNTEMARIELIVHGDKKKAEEEYELIKAGKQLFFSMSCRVPGDYCSICDHFAKNREEYCDHAKYEMGKIYENGKQAFVINKQPYFFDISRVIRPADRIAYQLQTKFEASEEPGSQVKAAQTEILSGSELAKKAGIVAPSVINMLAEHAVSLKKQLLTEKLAEFSDRLDACLKGRPSFGDPYFEHALRQEYFKALLDTPETQISDEEMQKLASVPPAVLFREMANRQLFFNFQDFCRYIKNASRNEISQDPVVRQAEKYWVPQLFKQACPEHAEADTVFDEESCELAEDPVQQLLDRITNRQGLAPKPVRARMMMISISCKKFPSFQEEEKFEKSCSTNDDQKAKILADFYGLYKIANLARIDSKLLTDEFLALVILQNRMNKTNNN